MIVLLLASCLLRSRATAHLLLLHRSQPREQRGEVVGEKHVEVTSRIFRCVCAQAADKYHSVMYRVTAPNISRNVYRPFCIKNAYTPVQTLVMRIS